MAHFDEKHYGLLRAIHAAGGVPCGDFPELFYPEEIRDETRRRLSVVIAKRICGQCPIKADCFRYAVESGQKYGIWGGTSPNER